MRIAGVRPKPAGMTGNLRDAAMAGRISQTDIIDLINKGFYPTAEGGLLSNEWRTAGSHHRRASCTRCASARSCTAGATPSCSAATRATTREAGPGENRYVFITAEFDEAALPEPPESDADAHASWERRVAEGREKTERLAARFARWYYVVAAEQLRSNPQAARGLPAGPRRNRRRRLRRTPRNAGRQGTGDRIRGTLRGDDRRSVLLPRRNHCRTHRRHGQGGLRRGYRGRRRAADGHGRQPLPGSRRHAADPHGDGRPGDARVLGRGGTGATSGSCCRRQCSARSSAS